ncbi:hypothetical protein Peur_050039 [Populus x canadensis]
MMRIELWREGFSELNSAIDEVSAQLHPEDAPSGIAVASDEIQASIQENLPAKNLTPSIAGRQFMLRSINEPVGLLLIFFDDVLGLAFWKHWLAPE